MSLQTFLLNCFVFAFYQTMLEENYEESPLRLTLKQVKSRRKGGTAGRKRRCSHLGNHKVLPSLFPNPTHSFFWNERQCIFRKGTPTACSVYLRYSCQIKDDLQPEIAPLLETSSDNVAILLYPDDQILEDQQQNRRVQARMIFQRAVSSTVDYIFNVICWILWTFALTVQAIGGFIAEKLWYSSWSVTCCSHLTLLSIYPWRTIYS